VRSLVRAVAPLTGWRRGVLREEELALPRWPAGLDGLRVAVVADLHAGAPQVGPERVRGLVGAVLSTGPDLVLLAGDVVDHTVLGGERPRPEAIAAALSGLRAAPLGVRAVLGNHDRLFGAGAVATALRHQGIDVLEDEGRRLEHRGHPLWVAGVGGTYAEPADARPALSRVPPGEPVLLLAHEPDVFTTVPDRVALTVAGHTHGGQIAVPGLRALWTPSRHGARYARRHVVEDGRHLVVTSGVGTSRLPLRLGAPPEALVLRLRSPGSFGTR
jgi:uncharacterized protein